MRKITERFEACGLRVNPDKTRIVYCKDVNRKEDYPVTNFTFLSYTFRPRQGAPGDRYEIKGASPCSERVSDPHWPRVMRA